MKSRENWILLAGAIVGAVLFFCLFSLVAPTAKLNLAINHREAQELAGQYLQALGYDTKGFDEYVSLGIDNLQECFLQAHSTGNEEREQINRHCPAAFWEVIYRHPERNERYHVKLSAAGRAFQFEHVLPSNVPGANLAQEAAGNLVKGFLARHENTSWSNYELVDAQTIKRESRTDHMFKWAQQTPAIGGLQLRLEATVLGDQVGGWGRRVQVAQAFSEQYKQKTAAGDLFETAPTILVIALFVISLITFIRRFHAGEASIRNALLPTGLILIVVLFFSIQSSAYLDEWRRLTFTEDNRTFYTFITYANVVIFALFSALGVFLVWASGESITREIWPDKLKTFDALFAGRFFFPELGSSILQGFGLAMIQLGVGYLATYCLSGRPEVWMIVGKNERMTFSTFMPVGLPIVAGLYITTFMTSYAPLFTLSFLKRHLKSMVLAIAISILMFDTVFSDTTIHSRWIQAGLAVLAGIITYFFYWRYDLFTVAVGMAVNVTLYRAMTDIVQPDGHYQAAGWSSLGLLGAVLIYGYLAYQRGAPLDESAITPAYARHITERERLKMEMEIARKAQLRMLPQTIPQLPGLDIAAFSEPAREVGGDYFDFVVFEGNRLGLVIGDVSGKGMPAALYMTLTKGFLQARADLQTPPREILCRMNRSFYQSAERNVFVTLLYCVIDPSARKMVYARAGHNPIIVRHNSSRTTTLLQSPGLAVGLERGEVFERIIKQESIDIHSGDTLVFYTDGLTEGMNHVKEEFGETRLLEVIERADHGTALDLLASIQKAHEAFVGREEQHDDLTCLVVKIS